MKRQSRYEDFIKYSTEGIFLLEYHPPIPIDLPAEEQYRLSVERGVITECNDAIARMYGYSSREEMIGARYKDIYQEEGIEENLEGNVEFIRAGYKLMDLETEEVDVNGEKVIFLNNAIGIIEDGYFTGTWGTQRDITALKKAEQEIIQAYDTTLEGWAKVLELRDHETLQHSRRAVEVTIHLAKKLGISGKDLEDIRRGAVLHDVGKMGIPEIILHKPGPLNADERAVIETHPKNAYNLLSGIPFLEKALEIPYCHHERWDGKGYPRGLKGEDIPLSARIFTVVDVWDALLSERPYKKAWSEEKTLEYLRENAGTQFDPVMVKEFLDMLGSEIN